MGLSVGRNVLFYKLSEAPLTKLVIKDRVKCHNYIAFFVNRY